MITLEFFLFLVLIVLSGFFSSSEVAYTGITKGQLKRTRKSLPGALALWEKGPERVLATLLVSNNAVNAGVGVLAAGMAIQASAVFGLPGSLSTVLFGLGSSAIILIFGEIVPKIVARKRSLAWALLVTPAMTAWCAVVDPITRLAVRVTRGLLFRLPKEIAENPFFTPDEVNHILAHSNVPIGSRKILNNVLDFSRSNVSDIMTHRSEMFAVSILQPGEKMIKSIIQSGYSRIPVFGGGRDDIRGILYSKDLLVAWRNENLILFEELIRPALFVDPDLPLPKLLEMFRPGRQHMALVRTRDGKRILGLVTIQDALEAIFGDIREEV